MDSQRNYKIDPAGAEAGIPARATRGILPAQSLRATGYNCGDTHTMAAWDISRQDEGEESTVSCSMHPKKVLRALPVASDGEELACTGASRWCTRMEQDFEARCPDSLLPLPYPENMLGAVGGRSKIPLSKCRA